MRSWSMWFLLGWQALPAVPVTPAASDAGRCRPAWVPAFDGRTPDAYVQSLAVLDAGDGPALYAGGTFTHVGALEASRIARWDGTAWTALGSGVTGANPSSTIVRAMAAFDAGTGPQVVVGGFFASAGGVPAASIARWDGSAWSALGTGITGSVSSLVVFDDGTGPALYAGGSFSRAGGRPASGIARWDGASWSSLPDISGFARDIRAFAVAEERGRPALYAAGFFETIGGVSANHVARWNGSTWSALGSGMDQEVEALAFFDDGSGPKLYAGGNFLLAGGVPARRMARWDGARWEPVGTGATALIATVFSLVVFDDGTGPALHAGGFFGPMGGQTCNDIARWDGTAWSPLAPGFLAEQVESLTSLAVFDRGFGPELYAGGSFPLGPVNERHLTRWVGCGPTLTAARVLPAQGPSGGGNTVKILGSGIAPGTRVTFDGRPGVVSVASPAELTVVVPARVGPAGPIEVRVTSPFGRQVSVPGGYTYVDGRSSARR